MTWEEGDYYDVDFQVHQSRRYHSKFRAFYLAVHNACKVASAVSSTSAFASLLAGSAPIATFLTAVVGIASTIDLLLGFEGKARLHDRLCRGFTDLAAEIVQIDATEEKLREIRAQLLRLEKDEPTERRLIAIQARNEELRARGCPEDEMAPLTKAQRFLGFVFTFGLADLEAWKARRQKEAA